MIKDTTLLTKTLLDYLKSQLVIMKKDGVVINLDATLMSVVNILLAKQLEKPFTYKVIACVTNNNKFALTQVILIAKQLGVDVEVRDLSDEYDKLLMYSGTIGVSLQKRITDLTLNITADSHNLYPVSNLCYSQWVIDFPHKCYQNLEQVNLLNRLFYSEVAQLAKALGASDSLINREPSHYLHRTQVDKNLGFTYAELEDFLRNPRQPKSLKDKLIADKLVGDNRNWYFCPVIQRPSNLLG